MNIKKDALFEQACKLIAFQTQAPNTVRRGLAALEADPALAAECEDIYGMPFSELKEGMLALADLDYEYPSENLFA